MTSRVVFVAHGCTVRATQSVWMARDSSGLIKAASWRRAGSVWFSERRVSEHLEWGNSKTGLLRQGPTGEARAAGWRASNVIRLIQKSIYLFPKCVDSSFLVELLQSKRRVCWKV